MTSGIATDRVFLTVISYPEGTGKSWAELNESPASTIGDVLVDADSQVFDSSFLPSRQQRQFVVHAPQYNLGCLQLNPDPDAIESPSVTSSFEFVVHEAVDTISCLLLRYLR